MMSWCLGALSTFAPGIKIWPNWMLNEQSSSSEFQLPKIDRTPCPHPFSIAHLGFRAIEEMNDYQRRNGRYFASELL